MEKWWSASDSTDFLLMGMLGFNVDTGFCHQKLPVAS